MSDHHHDHDHDHDHSHKPAPMVDEVSDFEILEMAVRELAIEKGLFSAEDHRVWKEYVHTLGPLPAARLVAKAWLDPEYKKLCIEDGVEASNPILGQSPEWYRTPNYRRRLVRWPRQVLTEFGLQLPPEVEVRVADSNQKTRYIVMPVRPEGTEGWTEDQLAEIVTRDCLIGVAVPKPGITANAKRPVIKANRPVHHDH
ncbi:MAG: nitrile hydratase subunit alpha [Methylotetracoccus sp.]|nr:nitrile hydratase subunit alpha [Methylotetracoccus sp.]